MTLIRRLLPLLLLAGGAAHAATDGFQPSLADVRELPRYTVNGDAVAKSLALAETSKSRPLRFAVATPLALGMDQGQWSTSGGTAVWRVRVASPGALSIGLEFARVSLPAAAALYIYDTAGALVQGPYTAADVAGNGQLWTALVQSDEAVIEARVPLAERAALQVQLGNLDHGFIDFTNAAGIAKAANSLGGQDAGACEINVACTQGDNWRNEIRSAAVITINNQTICSGTLVNDIPQRGKPYFLTANHCGISSSNLASSVVFYWNYQASTCSGNSGSLSQNQSGSSLIAGDQGSDFTLLQLNQTPSSSFDVYYAGFDASGAGASSGVGIHHPSGDIKKISSSCTATSQQTITLPVDNTNRTVQAWQVTWDTGVTEPGSSGSGFWNQNRQIIGVLSGGETDQGCATPTSKDFYGRLDVAWTANSASSGQLKATLDPGNTGQRSICGQDAAALAAGTKCTTSTVVTTACSASGSTTGGGSIVAGKNNGGSGGGALSPLLLTLLAASAGFRRRRS